MVTLKRLTQWAATLHDCQSQHRLSVTERVHYHRRHAHWHSHQFQRASSAHPSFLHLSLCFHWEADLA